MFLYFFLLEKAFFHDVMSAALALANRHQSFGPCRQLCRGLLVENSAIPHDSVVRAVLGGLPWDRAFWHALVGECLVHGARDIPRLQTAPDSLCCLLAPDQYGKTNTPRSQYAPIQQAHFGARDLRFGGGYHRPDHAGLNDGDDVGRLAAYLAAIDPAAWVPRDLQSLADCTTDEERAEELAYVRDWWPDVVALYESARHNDWVVVCEQA